MPQKHTNVPDAVSLSLGPINERDITRLLLEEFATSTGFQEWFLEQVLERCYSAPVLVGVSGFVMEASGESDLEVRFATSQGELWFLIENKLDVGFQPYQAERYQERGRRSVVHGQCVAVQTVLIAPERYFGDPQALQGFDAKLTYEAVRKWFLEQHPLEPRRSYKVALLEAAINKAISGYQLTPDTAVSKFWQAYRDMAQQYAPELQMSERWERGANSGFLYFHPEELPKNVQLIHKILKKVTQGHVDLQFGGMGKRFTEFTQTFAAHLEQGMQLAQAGASGVIRLVAPALNFHADFVPQADNAREGLHAAKQLAAWLSNHQALVADRAAAWHLTKKS